MTHPGFVQGGQPGYRPRKNNTNAVVAGAVAAVIIVGGIATTIVLASNSKPTGNGALAAQPSGASASNVAVNPSGAASRPTGGVQTPTGSISIPAAPPVVNGTGLHSADSAGYEYFLDLGTNDYDGTRALFCDPASFPLSESDVAQVETAYSDGPSTGGQTTAVMTGQVVLQDTTSGTVTIYLDVRSDSTWCVDHMESQQN